MLWIMLPVLVRVADIVLLVVVVIVFVVVVYADVAVAPSGVIAPAIAPGGA